MESLTQRFGSMTLDDCWNRIGIRGDRSCSELEHHIHCRNCPTYSAAARQLLDTPKPSDEQMGLTERLAAPAAESSTTVDRDRHSVIIFRLCEEWFAIRTGVCLEVAESRPLHSLPHRRGDTILGLANVRGDLLVCVSLTSLMGVSTERGTTPASRPRGAAPNRLMVLQIPSGPVASPVDEVDGIERVRQGDMKALPSTVAAGKATHTEALLRVKERTIGLINEQLLFSSIERHLA
jgi:chemotaxis-related protein WspD